MDLSNISFNELKALLTQIPKEIERREKEERARARKAIEELAAERGFSLSDLLGDSAIKKERSPVAVKYKHPTDTSLNWTGRGRQPKWVATFLADGGTLDQLSI